MKTMQMNVSDDDDANCASCNPASRDDDYDDINCITEGGYG